MKLIMNKKICFLYICLCASLFACQRTGSEVEPVLDMTYDSCCCLTDWFHLYAAYEGADYCAEDRFEYRNHAISMEEFEAIRDSIQE